MNAQYLLFSNHRKPPHKRDSSCKTVMNAEDIALYIVSVFHVNIFKMGGIKPRERYKYIKV